MEKRFKIKHIKQHDEIDCGAACISMICSYYGKEISIPQIRSIIHTDKNGTNIYGIVTGTNNKIGLNAEALEGEYSELLSGIESKEIKFPFVARILSEHGFEHYIVIFDMKNDAFQVGDPEKNGITYLPLAIFKDQWLGNIITFEYNSRFEIFNQSHQKINFIRHFADQKKSVIGVLLIAFLIAGVNIFQSYAFKYIIDELTINGVQANVNGIILISVICAIAFFISYGLSLIKNRALANSVYTINKNITNEFCENFFKTDAMKLSMYNSGDLLSRFYELDNIRNMVSSVIVNIIFNAMMMIFSAFFLISISPILFIETLVLALSYVLVILIFKKEIERSNRKLKEENALTTSIIKEVIHGFYTLKRFDGEKYAQKKVEDAHQNLFNVSKDAMLINSKQSSLVSTVYSINIILFLLLGTMLFINGNISVGSLVAYYSMINFFMDPLFQITSMQPQIQSSQISSERLNDVVELKEDNDFGEKFSGVNDSICLKNVNYRYGSRDLVIKNLSLSIKARQKIAIIGESGCGKTTMAKLLTGDLLPESGYIYYDGKPTSSLNKWDLRANISYIEQESFLMNDTIRNNLVLGRNINDDDLWKALDICSVGNFVRSLPGGLDAVIRENGKNISGGQKQRLSIARAILSEPSVLIMDEATSNLDNVTERAIMEALNQISVNTTVIIIAHRLKTVKNCDCIFIMNKGNISDYGTHDELLVRNEWYRQQWT